MRRRRPSAGRRLRPGRDQARRSAADREGRRVAPGAGRQGGREADEAAGFPDGRCCGRRLSLILPMRCLLLGENRRPGSVAVQVVGATPERLAVLLSSAGCHWLSAKRTRRRSSGASAAAMCPSVLAAAPERRPVPGMERLGGIDLRPDAVAVLDPKDHRSSALRTAVRRIYHRRRWRRRNHRRPG